MMKLFKRQHDWFLANVIYQKEDKLVRRTYVRRYVTDDLENIYMYIII